MKYLIALCIAIILSGTSSWADDCSPVVLDHKPADVLWRIENVVTARSAGDILMVQTINQLIAVHPKSGQPIWRYPLKTEYRNPDYIILETSIVAVKDERYLDFLDRSTGKLLYTIDIGECIYSIAGPPLVAVTNATNEDKSTIVYISEDGEKTSKLLDGRVCDIFVLDEVAVVEFYSISQNHESILAGYSVDPIKQIWSIKGNTFNTQILGGQLHFGNIFWDDGAQPIDVRTGELGKLVPPRAPAQIGGSGAFDIEVTATVSEGRWDERFAACERLRRNNILTGAPIWSIDLPFRINYTKGIIRDGNTLYVAGSYDLHQHFLVALDWATGSVKSAWTGIPYFWALEKMDDIVFGYDHGGELVAISVNNN